MRFRETMLVVVALGRPLVQSQAMCCCWVKGISRKQALPRSRARAGVTERRSASANLSLNFCPRRKSRARSGGCSVLQTLPTMFSTPTQRATRSRAQTPGSRAGTPSARAGPGAGSAATGGLFDTSFASSAAVPAATPSASRRRRTVLRSKTPFDPTAGNERAGSVSASRGGTPATAAGSTPTGAGVGAKAFHQAMTTDTASVTLQPGTVLVRDAFHAVTAYSRMPTEVAAMLDSADLYSTTCFGYLDIALGLAYLATATECLVWNFLAAGPGSSAASASPTCYILPNPSADSSSSQATSATAGADLPYLYTFVPWQSGQRAGEPGLLAVGKRDGEIYFAESITAGTGYTLGGGATAGQLKIPLAYGETITVAHLMTVGNAQAQLDRTARGTDFTLLFSEQHNHPCDVYRPPLSRAGGFLGRTRAAADHAILAIARLPRQALWRSR